jgi:urease accessory protein
VTNQLLDLLQITDRTFPTGSFVHSHGLEWLVKNQGVPLHDVLLMRLNEQLAHFELVFLVHAYSMDARDLDERFHAMLLPRESRDASVQVGRQLLRNVCALFENPDLFATAGDLPYGHYPVAYGMVGKAIGLPPETSAESYAFQTVRGQISAAQRLTRLGQTEAQKLLHHLKPAIERAVEVALDYPLEEAGPFAPMLDIAAMAHERSEVRLFVS